MESDSPSPALSDTTRDRAELRRVIAMTVPVVLTTGSRALMDFVDFSLVSMLPDAGPQAAILPAQMLVWVYLILGMGTVSVVSTFASQALGSGRHAECSAYAWQSVHLSLLVGAIGVALIPLLGPAVRWIGHDPAVQAHELAYARVVMLAAGPTLATGALGWFFVGIHRPWVAAWSVIEGNLINAAVSYVLIFGKLGFEPMGIAGAAWGTLVALSFRTIRLIVTLLMQPTARIYASRQTWRPDVQKLANFLRVGLPCGVRWFSEVVVWAAFVHVLIGSRFGTADLIATGAVWQYMRVGFMPTLGVGQALSALVGKSLGEANPQRAIREVRWAAGIAAGYMGALSLIYAIFGAELVGLFSSDPAVVAIGRKIMWCAAVFQLFDALGIIYDSALRGAGDTFVPAVFFAVWTWLSILGGGWLLMTAYPQWKSLGPWIAASGCIVVTGWFLWWRWHGRAWMKIDIFRMRDRVPSTVP